MKLYSPQEELGMAEEISRLIDRMIDLENAAADLYMYYHSTFPEDGEFWWTLMMEEKNHASLIRGGRNAFLNHEGLPREMLTATLEELNSTIDTIQRLLDRYKKSPPTRGSAFRTAVKLETSAGEFHFQKAMTRSSNSEMMQLFQQLNKDDRNHGRRIREYMKEHGIGD
jgi:hypothetical protein